MFKQLGHPCLPFLTAAIAALVAYRLLESGLGLSGREIFVTGFVGAVAMSLALALTGLFIRARQE
jgi:hypothetical protein